MPGDEGGAWEGEDRDGGDEVACSDSSDDLARAYCVKERQERRSRRSGRALICIILCSLIRLVFPGFTCFASGYLRTASLVWVS